LLWAIGEALDERILELAVEKACSNFARVTPIGSHVG
jgi:hypothetical protein